MDCKRGEMWKASSLITSTPAILLLCFCTLFLQWGCSSAEESDRNQAPAPLVKSPSERDKNAYDGGLGFVVPFRPDCPKSCIRKGAQPPDGFREWCERTGPDAGTKHGWYAEWFADGRPSVAGEYSEGLQRGVWTRWYPSGSKRVQAEFEGGLQHGRLISWTEAGVKLGEQHYANGSPL